MENISVPPLHLSGEIKEYHLKKQNNFFILCFRTNLNQSYKHPAWTVLDYENGKAILRNLKRDLEHGLRYFLVKNYTYDEGQYLRISSRPLSP